MAKCPAWPLLLIFYLLETRVLCQGFDLSDAGTDAVPKAPVPKPDPEPAGGAGAKGGDLSQKDLFGATLRPGLLPRTTTRVPRTTGPPPRHQPALEFDLVDALDPKNDIRGKGQSGKGGDQFSDSDLSDLDGYTPDKGKGGRREGADSANDNLDTMTETVTIASIFSAVAMALVGAVGSYISYQKKKLCFSIQQGLNAEMMKEDNPEIVVSQEPQVQQTLLQAPNTEPPQQ